MACKIAHWFQLFQCIAHCWNFMPSCGWGGAKNVKGGRDWSCYEALMAMWQSLWVWHHTTCKHLNLVFDTLKINSVCGQMLFNWYVKENSNILSQLNQLKLCVGYPQTVHDPSWYWQYISWILQYLILVCLFGGGGEWGKWFEQCTSIVLTTAFQVRNVSFMLWSWYPHTALQL